MKRIAKPLARARDVLGRAADIRTRGEQIVVRMAVLSDPHACSEAGKRSWVCEEQSDPAENPFAGLRHLISSTPELKADVLLCPGDLCDQADWDALPYAWRQLEGVAEALGAEQLVATVGNHDIDSHDIHGATEIAHGLRTLAPDFPTRDSAAAAVYWDDRAIVLRGENWQVVSLNSSLMRHLEEHERDHGHVSDPTLALINERLSEDRAPVNVLLCHHHPQPFTRLVRGDHSHMIGGDRLVRLLNDLPANWMVVHGHKHEPNLDYLEGSGGSATRLASGSLGVNLMPRLGLHVRNQIHLIEFPVSECRNLNLSLAGRVRSWTWQPTTGWRPALPRGDGLPGLAGFGHRIDGPAVANELVQWGRANSVGVIERAAMLSDRPRLEFMLPNDIDQLHASLREDHGCHVSITSDGVIDRVILPLP